MNRPCEVLVGFDSAWADDPRRPGAIALLVRGADGVVRFVPPVPAGFARALDLIHACCGPRDLLLVAIDQPTRVPNAAGARPAERVAASLVGRLGGGVQPGFRGGRNAAMFGDGAPIWGFLSALGAEQDPERARTAAAGRFVMEVFPALALPALAPAIWQRGRAAKYNPAIRTYRHEDWRLVCGALAGGARSAGLDALAAWAEEQDLLEHPRKRDQDALDAALCLLVAHLWRHGPRHRAMLLGDREHGHIVCPVSSETGAVLRNAASRIGVPVDAPWSGPVRPPHPVRGRRRPRNLLPIGQDP